jgi:hypothetical protein
MVKKLENKLTKKHKRKKSIEEKKITTPKKIREILDELNKLKNEVNKELTNKVKLIENKFYNIITKKRCFVEWCLRLRKTNSNIMKKK